jgi:crossover junction endodeoxyribonuclease RuvC
MTVLGIDPGLDGALALLDCRGKVIEIVDMPTVPVVINKKNRRQVPPALLASVIERLAPSVAFLEHVSTRPGEGAVGAFSFGRSFGCLEGVLATLQIPVTLVYPATWKRALNIPADKGGARMKAMSLFPEVADQFKLKKHDGRAEAGLIALYGLRR